MQADLRGRTIKAGLRFFLPFFLAYSDPLNRLVSFWANGPYFMAVIPSESGETNRHAGRIVRSEPSHLPSFQYPVSRVSLRLSIEHCKSIETEVRLVPEILLTTVHAH